MNKLIGLRAVNLVRGEPDRLAKFAQERHDFLIEGRDAGTGIDDQDDSIGFTKRRVSLSVNPSTNNFVFRVRVEPAGIDDANVPCKVLKLAVPAISR
jgi:hypothetical protein